MYYLKKIIKKIIFLNNLIIKIKFFFNLGLEKEAIYLKKNYNFINSIDIGSNAGHFTNMLSKISKRVYSFEPINHLFESQKYLFKNSNVTNYKIALGSRKQNKKFYIPYNNEPEASLIKRKNSKVTKVFVNKGDNIIKKAKISFVKIDVEGTEMNVLKGLKKIIKQNFPLFLIEIEKRHNKDFLSVFRFLDKYKYKIYYLDKKKMKLINLEINKLKKFLKKNQVFSELGSEKYINNFFFKRN